MHGGDEDLPRREPLHERRAKFDAAAARRGARGPGGSEDGEDGGAEEYDLGGAARRGGKRRAGGEEDDFYQAAKVGLRGGCGLRGKHSTGRVLGQWERMGRSAWPSAT